MGQETLSLKFRAVVNFSKHPTTVSWAWWRAGCPPPLTTPRGPHSLRLGYCSVGDLVVSIAAFPRAGLEPDRAFVTVLGRHFQTTVPGPAWEGERVGEDTKIGAPQWPSAVCYKQLWPSLVLH